MRKALLLLLIPLCSFPTFAQADGDDVDSTEAQEESRRIPRTLPKASVGEIMATISGIGIDRFNPPLNSAATPDGSWTGVNLLMYMLEMQVGWGRCYADVSKLDPNRFGGTSVGSPTVPVYGRNWAIGINLPIAAKSLGINSRRTGSLLRAHFFGAFSIGGMSLWDNYRVNKTTYAFATLAPGFRVYNNFLTVEARLLGQIGLGVGEYKEYISQASLNPVLTVRVNGLYKKLVQGTRLVGSTSYSIDNVQSSSKTDRITHADGVYDRTTTTTSGTVSSSRGTSALADIGRYVGIGPRVTFTRPFMEHYSGQTLLYGLGLQARVKKIVLGLNAENGKAGHASITDNRGEEKRKVNKTSTYARGQLNATNVFADLGFDISSLAKGLLARSLDDDNDVATFASLNFGYSVGYSLIGGQSFEDEGKAVPGIDGIVQNTRSDNNKRNDPRESSSGIVGGFFLGFDMGNVGMKLQWYRYKNAPLANNLCYTLSYRFARGRR